MAFTIPNSADAAFPAQAEPDSRDFDIITAASAQTGVVTGCTVATTGTTNGSVTVAAGTVRYAGRKITVAGGTVAITANATGNPRLDLITVDTSAALAAVAGTAAATPVFPTIPASRVVLAAVYVATGHTTGTNLASNTITDKRVTISDAELENVFWYGATGNARSFTITTGTSGSGVITSQLATPTGVGTSTSTTTGALAAATYGYRVTAYNQYGETTASTTVTRVTTGTTSTVTISWTAVAGAIGYRVYGRTSGSELMIQNVQAPTTSWTDRGESPASGALPSSNTTGPFTSAMVGRSVYITGAGAAGVQYAGTVSTFTSATQITVTPNLSTTPAAGANAAVGTNDATAIDAAVAALSSGSTLYFPAGQYLDASGVAISNKYNITVTGDYATLISAVETNPVLYILNSAQIGIDRLRIQHATTTVRNNFGYGVQVKWCQDVVVEDMYVSNTCAAGIFLDGVTRATVVANTVKDTLADGIHSTNASTDIDVVGNRLIGVGDDAIAFVGYRKDGNQVARFTATTNAIWRCAARGIGIVGGAQGSIVGNTINETKAAGIIAAQETSFITYGCKDITIEGNTIISANTYNSPSADHAAIHVSCADATFPISGVSIIGNHIRTPRRYGVIADGATGGITELVVSNNSYIGPSTDSVAAYLMGGGVASCRVYGNRIAYAMTDGIDNYATRAVIVDNEVYYPNQSSGAGASGIALLGGNAIIRDNIVTQDAGKTALSTLISAAPTAGMTGNAGTSPPSPIVEAGSTDQAGSMTFGTGSGTPTAGSNTFVLFRTDMGLPPKVMICAGNAAAAALLPYVVIVYGGGFEIGLTNAPAASQGNTTYRILWQVVPA